MRTGQSLRRLDGYGRAAPLLVLVLLCSSRGIAAVQTPRWYSPPTTTVRTQAISFTDRDATLRGTLYLPEVGHKVPALVALHGASEPLARTPLYRHLTEALPQMGIAVLVFDRRGSGASTGKADVPYEVLAEDGVAGAQALRKLPTIDARHVGYWGVSQGGWLVTLAALRDPRAAFAVAVSAPLVTAESQMEFAMANRLHVLGYGKKDVDQMLTARYKLDGYFSGANSRQAAVAALTSIQKRPWFDQMYLPRPNEVSTDPAKSSWRGQMDIDFFGKVAQVKIPILYLMGDQDPWTPVTATVRRLGELKKTHPLLCYAVVADADHLMMFPVNENMDDADPRKIAAEMPQSPAYFTMLASWLERTAFASQPRPVCFDQRRSQD